MRFKAEPFLIGAAVVVVFGGYLWSTATSGINPVQWKDGDLIVQRSKAIPVLPVFGSKAEPPAHIGIVQITDAGPVVIEATDTVTETPLPAFIARGASNEFAAYRVPGLTTIQANVVIAAARARLGTPGDFFLDAEPDHIYSSELVRMAFGAVGINFAQTERLGDLAKDNPAVSAKFMGRWEESKPCKRRYLDYEQCWNVIAHYEVITPASIVSDQRMQKVFASPGMDQQVLAQDSPAPDAPATAGSGARLRP
jgi:hypothetical protein